MAGVHAIARYLRLWFALGRFGLARELAFRANFLVKITVELLWFAILLIFWDTVFAQTNVVAGWTQQQYMFFVGCYFTLEGLLETFFLSNCGEFSDLVRSGDLDFALLKPIDEQFLVTCRNIDWTTVPNIVLGGGVMIWSLIALEWPFDAVRLALFTAAVQRAAWPWPTAFLLCSCRYRCGWCAIKACMRCGGCSPR